MTVFDWIIFATGSALVINILTTILITVGERKRRRALAEREADAALKLNQVNELRRIAAEAVAEAQAQSLRADGNFRAVAILERERNQWQELYHKAGTGMSRGQSMLLAEIVRLSNLLKRPPDPKMVALVSEYAAEHAGDIEKKASQVKAQALLEPGPPPPPTPPISPPATS